MKRLIALALLLTAPAMAQDTSTPTQTATEQMLLEQINAHRDYRARYLAAQALNKQLSDQLADMKAKLDAATLSQPSPHATPK